MKNHNNQFNQTYQHHPIVYNSNHQQQPPQPQQPQQQQFQNQHQHRHHPYIRHNSCNQQQQLLLPPPLIAAQQHPTLRGNRQLQASHQLLQQQPQQHQQQPASIANLSAFNSALPTPTAASSATATATATTSTSLSSTPHMLTDTMAYTNFIQNQYNSNYLNYNNYNNNNNSNSGNNHNNNNHHHHYLSLGSNISNISNNLPQQSNHHYYQPQCNNNRQQLQLQLQCGQTQQQLQSQLNPNKNLQLQQQHRQYMNNSHMLSSLPQSQTKIKEGAMITSSATQNNGINASNSDENGGIGGSGRSSGGGDGGGGGAPGGGDKFAMDACEIANFLANELFLQQLGSMDGMQSGVPTLTTPTLTPTTLRSIEETFIQLTSDNPGQAGFIPPAFPPASTIIPNATTFNCSIQDLNEINESESELSQTSWSNAQLNEDNNSMATTDTSSAATDSTSFQNGLNSLATSNASSTNDFTAISIAIAAAKNGGILSVNNTSNSATPSVSTRRNHGGRRPTKATNMTPEEEQKRVIRRERNKLAAARCRKRRVDQTNRLLDEVAELEKKRDGLQMEIQNLKTNEKSLQFLLEDHRPTCKKIQQEILSVSTYDGLIVPTTNGNSNVSANRITGIDTSLASTVRSGSPIDLKPSIIDASVLEHIKNEPLDTAFDSNSSLDHDGPPSPKRILLSDKNPMIPPPLPNVSTISPTLATATLNTPIVTTAPISFGLLTHNNNNLTLNSLNKPPSNGSKQRPNSLPTVPRSLAANLSLNVDGKPPTDINGVAIQTPSTGVFNFDSLMDGGTGLTPVSAPLVPTIPSRSTLQLNTPTTSEPSKLVSL